MKSSHANHAKLSHIRMYVCMYLYTACTCTVGTYTLCSDALINNWKSAYWSNFSNISMGNYYKII